MIPWTAPSCGQTSNLQICICDLLESRRPTCDSLDKVFLSTQSNPLKIRPKKAPIYSFYGKKILSSFCLFGFSPTATTEFDTETHHGGRKADHLGQKRQGFKGRATQLAAASPWAIRSARKASTQVKATGSLSAMPNVLSPASSHRQVRILHVRSTSNSMLTLGLRTQFQRNQPHDKLERKSDANHTSGLKRWGFRPPCQGFGA